MFDIAPSEFILFALVALVVIGPKDLPKAMRVVGRFVGKARGMARHFRSGFDAMVREAELEEMEKKWKEENERIMREHSVVTDSVNALPAPATDPTAMPEPAATVEPADIAPPTSSEPVPTPPEGKAA